MSHGPLEMTGAADAPTCVDGVCDLPVAEDTTPDED
jgi:hypothetical protein